MDLDRTPLGIAGAGTMGAGIATTARDAGLRVLLHDPDPAARDRVEGVEWAPALEDLAPCGVVIEAAPEQLDVKRALFGALAGVRGARRGARDQHVLAARHRDRGRRARARARGRAALLQPGRRMRLVELVAGRGELGRRARPRTARSARRWAST